MVRTKKEDWVALVRKMEKDEAVAAFCWVPALLSFSIFSVCMIHVGIITDGTFHASAKTQSEFEIIGLVIVPAFLLMIVFLPVALGSTIEAIRIRRKLLASGKLPKGTVARKKRAKREYTDDSF